MNGAQIHTQISLTHRHTSTDEGVEVGVIIQIAINENTTTRGGRRENRLKLQMVNNLTF